MSLTEIVPSCLKELRFSVAPSPHMLFTINPYVYKDDIIYLIFGTRNSARIPLPVE